MLNPHRQSRWRTAAIFATSGFFLYPGNAHAAVGDAPEAANDFLVPLSAPGDARAIPLDAIEAGATFERRAKLLLKWAGCIPKKGFIDPADPTKQVITIYRSDTDRPFDSPDPAVFRGLQDWGQDALARLAYDGICDLGGSPQSAATRWSDVDSALAKIQFFSLLGSSIDNFSKGFGASRLTLNRVGELDTGIKELIPILFMFAPNDIIGRSTPVPTQGRISAGTAQFLLNLLQNANSGPPPPFNVLQDDQHQVVNPDCHLLLPDCIVHPTMPPAAMKNGPSLSYISAVPGTVDWKKAP